MNDPLRGWTPVTVVAALAGLLVAGVAAPETLVRIAVLGLAGVAAVPLLGWLRTVWLTTPAVAGIAAWSAAAVLQSGQAVPVAVAVASVVGGAAGAAAAAGTARLAAPLRPWVGLALTVAVWGAVLPRASNAPTGRPVMFGLDLSTGRGLGGLALVLLAAGLWAVLNLARSGAGRGIAVTGASPTLARTAGVSAPRAWLAAGAVSGLLAAWVGVILVLQAQSMPPSNQFSPAVAVLWLAAPLLGGVSWPSGALLGAVVVAGISATLGVNEAVIAGAAVAVGAMLGTAGLVGVALRRSRP